MERDRGSKAFLEQRKLKHELSISNKRADHKRRDIPSLLLSLSPLPSLTPERREKKAKKRTKASEAGPHSASDTGAWQPKQCQCGAEMSEDSVQCVCVSVEAWLANWPRHSSPMEGADKEEDPPPATAAIFKITRGLGHNMPGLLRALPCYTC